MADKDMERRLARAEQILSELAENAKEEAKKSDRRAQENDRRAQENDRRVQENDRRVQENDRRAKEADLRAHLRAQEADLRAQEADLRAKEADRRVQENDRCIQATKALLDQIALDSEKRSKSVDRQLKRLGKQLGGEGNRWGKIIEDLVAGDLITIARDYIGVSISYVSTRVRPEDRSWEIDVLGVNQGAVIVAEVKTTLTKKDIDKFLASIMLPFTSIISKHQHKQIYGIIAYVKVERGKESEVINYAWSKGLLVVKAMDGTNRVLEGKDFTLRDYGIGAAPATSQ